MMRFLALTLLTFLVSASAAHAESKDWFCDTLRDKAAYNQNPDLRDFKYMVPGKGNWIFETSNDLKHDYSIHPSSLNLLEKITAEFKARGIDLIILQMPNRGLAHADQFPDNINDYSEKGPFDAQKALESYRTAAPEYNKRYTINLVNIPDFKTGDPFYYTTDLHWNAQGAKRMARAIAEYIDSHEMGQTLVKGTYETHFANKIPYKKAYPQLIEKTCKNTVPAEEVEIYETAKISSDVNSSALFADLYPQIVLIGTSFSLQQNAAANFQGFLEESIKTDILNMSIAGGGEETAMLNYLRLGEYKNEKTKIAIWEIPGHYRLNLATFIPSFEQIYANMTADCAAPLAGGNITISERSKLLLDATTANLPLGQDLALRLTYDTAISPNLTYIYRTQGKDGEIHRYKREIKWPPIAGKHTSLLTTLDVRDDERLLAVTYRGSKPLNGVSVEGQLCRLRPAGS